MAIITEFADVDLAHVRTKDVLFTVFVIAFTGVFFAVVVNCYVTFSKKFLLWRWHVWVS